MVGGRLTTNDYRLTTAKKKPAEAVRQHWRAWYRGMARFGRYEKLLL
jgi:hypothetical protein